MEHWGGDSDMASPREPVLWRFRLLVEDNIHLAWYDLGWYSLIHTTCRIPKKPSTQKH